MKKLLIAFAFLGFLVTSSIATTTSSFISVSSEIVLDADCDKCGKKDCDKKSCTADEKKKCSAEDKKKCSSEAKKACCAKKAEAKKACCSKDAAKKCSKSEKVENDAKTE